LVRPTSAQKKLDRQVNLIRWSSIRFQPEEAKKLNHNHNTADNSSPSLEERTNLPRVVGSNPTPATKELRRQDNF